jgi:hypothetical protein
MQPAILLTKSRGLWTFRRRRRGRRLNNNPYLSIGLLGPRALSLERHRATTTHLNAGHRITLDRRTASTAIVPLGTQLSKAVTACNVVFRPLVQASCRRVAADRGRRVGPGDHFLNNPPTLGGVPMGLAAPLFAALRLSSDWAFITGPSQRRRRQSPEIYACGVVPVSALDRHAAQLSRPLTVGKRRSLRAAGQAKTDRPSVARPFRCYRSPIFV